MTTVVTGQMLSRSLIMEQTDLGFNPISWTSTPSIALWFGYVCPSVGKMMVNPESTNTLHTEMDEQEEGDYDWVLCKLHQTLKSVREHDKKMVTN